MKKVETKFILFGQSRSGSTLLKSLLNSHKDIHCDGELFNPDEGYVINKLVLKFFHHFPNILINYRKLQTDKKIYGFTLFQYHLNEIEQYLNQMSENGWLLIHIYRENIFNQTISNLVAQETGVWHRHNNSQTSDNKIYIIPEKLLARLEDRVRWHQFENNVFKNLNHVKVVYEKDLSDNSNWDTSLAKVFDFLKVEPCHLTSDLLKTYSKPYNEIIENYDELLDFLKKTPMEYLIPD